MWQEYSLELAQALALWQVERLELQVASITQANKKKMAKYPKFKK